MINNGKGPQPDLQRDKALLRAYQAVDLVNNKWQFSIPNLVAKYDISTERIRQIREKYGVPPRGAAPSING